MDFNQNMNQLMKEAQKMQQRMQEAQQQLNQLIVQGAAGGEHKIEVTMNGAHDVTKVKIHPELMKESLEIIEDLMAAAFNDAVRKIEKVSREKISQLSAGLNIPTDILKDKES